MINRTLVIDSSALCYAYAHTLDQLAYDELEIGVVFGFLRQIRSLAKQFLTTDVVFCWDSKRSIREEMFPEYKAVRKARKKSDPELGKIYAAIIRQMKDLQFRILPHIGFENSFTQDGMEADDIIAEIVMGYENCIIVSGDDDLLQLLPFADIWNPGKKKFITNATFMEEWGIHSNQWAMVKAIAGCKSDEVPGIPNVGSPTAIRFLLDRIPHHHKIYQKILESKDAIIARNLPLVRLPLEGTKQITLPNPKKNYDLSKFWDICQEFQFKSFMTGTEKQKWELFFQGIV